VRTQFVEFALTLPPDAGRPAERPGLATSRTPWRRGDVRDTAAFSDGRLENGPAPNELDSNLMGLLQLLRGTLKAAYMAWNAWVPWANSSVMAAPVMRPVSHVRPGILVASQAPRMEMGPSAGR